jgi:origin recognition complex subunit 2
MSEHREYFRRWCTLLSGGFSILLCGYGSKRQLLCEFAEQWMTQGPRIFVDGFSRYVSIRELFATICSDVIQMDCRSRNLMTLASTIVDGLEAMNVAALHIVLHNIDGPALRNSMVQQSLALLASSPRVQLIATVDNVRSQLRTFN